MATRQPQRCCTCFVPAQRLFRAQEDAVLKVEIRAAHAASGKRYGSPRIQADLKADDHRSGAEADATAEASEPDAADEYET
jgi:hypothetical protein